MSNFASDIEAAAEGEPILGVVIHPEGESHYHDLAERRKVPARYGEVLAWEAARPMLDYGYDTGYGGVDCDAIWAWTETRVLFVGCYDGASWIQAAPRNPGTDIEAQTVGGG